MRDLETMLNEGSIDMKGHNSNIESSSPPSQSKYAFPGLVAVVLVSVLVLVAIPASLGKGTTTWWAFMSPVLAALIGILVAIKISKQKVRETINHPIETMRIFLICQFTICVALLLAALLEAVNSESSEITVVLLSSCIVLAILSGSFAHNKKQRALITFECAMIILVFVLPILIHNSTLHGRGDLFVHLNLAEQIAESGQIPHTSYESWSGWHVGVASLDLVSGIQVSLSAILLILAALLITIPLIGSFVERLSGRTNLATITSAVFLIGPALLTQTEYLTPTALCFGLFTIMLWAISIRRNFQTYAMLMLLGTTIVLSHSLSPVIIVVVLSAMLIIMILQNRKERSPGAEIQLNPIFTIIMTIMVFAYTSLTAASFFNINIASLQYGFQIEGTSIGIGEKSLLWYVIFSFSTNVIIFMIVSYLILRKLKGASILGIGPKSSLTFAIIAFLTFSAYLASVLPLQVFGSIELNRWAVYGWLFAAIAGGSIIMLFMTERRRLRPWVAVTLAIVLFLATLSAVAGSSYDTLPFRENKYKFPPVPYFTDSEIGLGKFVSNYYSGNLSSDAIFTFYFYRYPTANSAIIDYSLDGFNDGKGGWILRYEALNDRGLEYTKNQTGYYIDSTYAMKSFEDKEVNCVLDVGSSRLLILSSQ